MNTIYEIFYIAEIYNKDEELHKARICRDKNYIPRHWVRKEEAVEWAEVNTDDYVIIKRSVEYVSNNPVYVTDISSLTITTDI